MKTPGLIFTDLDGTLLDNQSRVSAKDRETLIRLGEEKHIRVIATGRSLYSIHQVLPINFPVDYVIFSSGAGTMNWQTKRMLQMNSIEILDVLEIGRYLEKRRLDFMLHYPIPENHHFVYKSFGNKNPDFERRIAHYKGYCEPLNFSLMTFGKACPFIIIVPTGNEEIYFELEEKFLDRYRVIRATSPLDHASVWIEIFRKNVSKGAAAKYLCEYLNLEENLSVGIGNDYNDLHLLRFTDESWLLENAPVELHQEFNIGTSNNNSGFSEVIEQLKLI